MDTKTKQKLKKFIRKLALIRGRHTELVSVYIPQGYDINKIINHLSQEQGTASNIKDKTTRTNVIDSLERMIRHLRLFKRTPENGLALFAGNISDTDSKTTIEVFSLEPPEAVKTRIYRCDQTFLLDPIINMIETKDMHGLVVLDRREATIGFLKGTSIKATVHMTSGVPGKIRAGGQCLSPDSLVMKNDGDIIKIKEAHNPSMIISENFNKELSEETPVIAKWENKKNLFKVTTCYPRMQIQASKDHIFFVRTEDGIKEKSLSNIKEGDYLITPEKINLNLKDQKIEFIPKIKRKIGLKKVYIPKKINSNFAKILGYYLGDGSYEIDRLTFFEQRKDVAKYYKTLIEKTFKSKANLKFRKSKNYYQIRIYSRIISQLFKKLLNKRDKTLSEKIPSIILKSSDESLASFIAGFFDAEGYSSSNSVALGINNKIIVKQLQLCLIRLGILSSILEYDNKRNPYSNKVRYSLVIDDIKSLNIFKEKINFASHEKKQKLNRLIKTRSNRSKVRQLAINGKEIARILKNSGYTLRNFRCPSFFTNKRQMSKDVFKQRILNNIKNEELKKRLELFYNSNLIIVKIAKIKKLNKQKTIDIETKNHNFIANGLIVHNSAQRFHRITEGLAKEFYKRIADACNKEFLGKKDLNGIIVGGPGPTKETFLNVLNQELKDKVIAVQDITYTNEQGLHDLVDKSKEVLVKEQITKEKEILTRFFTMLAKEPEKTTYGPIEVKKALEMGAVDILLISDDLDDETIERLEVEAEKTSTTVEILSAETREGVQLRDLTGVAAILRFPIS